MLQNMPWPGQRTGDLRTFSSVSICACCPLLPIAEWLVLISRPTPVQTAHPDLIPFIPLSCSPQRPMVVKDHQYESPILDIKWPTTAAGRSRALVASADRHIIKFWDAASGEGFTNIEPKDGDINDICLWPGSGLVMAGCDTPRIQASDFTFGGDA